MPLAVNQSKIFERGVTAPLTEDEKKMFQFIKLFVIKYYCQPSGQEISRYFKWNKDKTSKLFKSMEHKGWMLKYGKYAHILRDS
jgi:hypothetical protein